MAATTHASGSPAVSRRAGRSHDAALSGQSTTARIAPPRAVHASANAVAEARDAGSRL
ncbi:hypothetical protein ACWFRQ_27655 [Streptomyces niveus]